MSLKPSKAKGAKLRKELLQLNKKQLIKRCKQEKVSINGTKKDMVDRLVKKELKKKAMVKAKKGNVQVLEPIDFYKLSFAEKLYYEQSYIESMDRLTIFGYFRENAANKYNMNVPEQIIKFVIIFLFEPRDKWDPQNVGINHILKGNRIKDKKSEYCLPSTSFLTNTVYGGTHRWSFKTRNSYSMILGIWKTKSGDPPTGATFNCDGDGYALYVADGQTVPGLEQYYEVNEEEQDDGNFAVEMVLCFKSLTLKYIVNGVDHGVAFNVEDTPYKAALYTRTDRDNTESIKLITYQQTL